MSDYERGTIIVTVYSKTETFCGQCMATKRALSDLGVEYVEVSLESLPEAQIAAWREAGHSSAPIVTVPHKADPYWDVWSGYRPDLIATLV